MILQGTMQDGTVIPVQVDSQGRLVAEGLQGVQGPQGVRGNDGGSFVLPANPTEGKVLGWSSGGLAWVSPQWPQQPINSLPGTGYVPSTLGSPYWIDILPAAAALYSSSNNAKGFGCLTDGATDTWVTRTNSTQSDLFTRARLDLRSFADPQVDLTVGIYSRLMNAVAGNSVTFSILDATRTRIGAAITKSNLEAAVTESKFPATKGVRFLEIAVTAPAPSAFSIYFAGVSINGGLINYPQFATATASATPV